MKRTHYFPIQTKKGFSLIEALVAISILLVSVMGTLYITSRGISIASSSRDQTVAFFLGQEAAEYIKNERDNNVLAGDGWLDGLGVCVGNSCTVDVAVGQVASCAGACPPLWLSSEGGYNQADEGEETLFTRSVKIEEVVPNQEAIVMVSVTWSWKRQPKSFTTEVPMFNWQIPPPGVGASPPPPPPPLPDEETFINPAGPGGETLCGNRTFDDETRQQFCFEKGYATVLDFTEISSGGACAFYNGSWQVDGSHSFKTNSLTCANP